MRAFHPKLLNLSILYLSMPHTNEALSLLVLGLLSIAMTIASPCPAPPSFAGTHPWIHWAMPIERPSMLWHPHRVRRGRISHGGRIMVGIHGGLHEVRRHLHHALRTHLWHIWWRWSPIHVRRWPPWGHAVHVSKTRIVAITWSVGLAHTPAHSPGLRWPPSTLSVVLVMKGGHSMAVNCSRTRELISWCRGCCSRSHAWGYKRFSIHSKRERLRIGIEGRGWLLWWLSFCSIHIVPPCACGR